MEPEQRFDAGEMDAPGAKPLRRKTVRRRAASFGFARLRKPALWAALVLVCVEPVLQLSAMGTWYVARNSTKPAAPLAIMPHLALFIGDSETFGSGGTSWEFSYPSAAEKLLQKDDKSWQVVNAGQPEQNSSEALLSLAAQLKTLHPSRVYIMAGEQDYWRGQKSPELSSDFHWRWRTPLLLQSAGTTVEEASEQIAHTARSLRSRWSLPSGPSPIGIWTYQGRIIQVRDDGVVKVDGRDLLWKTKGNQMEWFPRNGLQGQTLHVRWERRKDQLYFKGGQFPSGILLDPAALPPAIVDTVPLNQTELEAALKNGGPADKFRIRAQLARAYAGEGKRREAAGELEKMRRELDEAGDPAALAQVWVNTAQSLGESAKALEAARVFARRYPDNASFEGAIAWQSFQSHDFETATVAIDKAIHLETGPDAGNNSSLASLFAQRAAILLPSDPQKSLESAIESYSLNKDKGVLEKQLESGLAVYQPKVLEASFRALRAPSQIRQDIQDAFVELSGTRPGIESTLAENLRRMADMARKAGAEVVFLSYPVHETDTLNDRLRKLAKEKGAGWIDLEAMFAERLKTSGKEDLFAGDGNLNDEGSALVASVLAADIRQRNQLKAVR